MRRNRLIAASSMAAVLFLSACSAVQDGPAGVGSRTDGLSLAVGDRNELYGITPGVVNVCAFFPYLGTAEDFSGRKGTFAASAPAGENVLSGNFLIQPIPSCIEIWNARDADLIPVTASLVANHPGYEIDRIVVGTGDGTADPVYVDTYGVQSATVSVNNAIGGYLWFKFRKIELPPQGGQGCTPGYWRQSHHYDSWVGYSPDQLFSSVFADAFPGKTLGQVVALGGGGLNALGRMSVAALLNASSTGVSFDLPEQLVINSFNSAYVSGNRRRIEDLKNEFDMLNNQGCPLN